MTMDEMVVYCAGPKGSPHPRRVLRRYTRANDGTWGQPHSGNPADRYGELAKPADFPAQKDHGDTIELRCKDCRYNPKRRLDRAYGRNFPPFDVVFEKLWEHGKFDISAKELVEVVWP